MRRITLQFLPHSKSLTRPPPSPIKCCPQVAKVHGVTISHCFCLCFWMGGGEGREEGGEQVNLIRASYSYSGLISLMCQKFCRRLQLEPQCAAEQIWKFCSLALIRHTAIPSTDLNIKSTSQSMIMKSTTWTYYSIRGFHLQGQTPAPNRLGLVQNYFFQGDLQIPFRNNLLIYAAFF